MTAIDETQGRCGMYRLLAQLWLREIDQSLLREIQTTPLRDAFQAAGGAVPPVHEGILEQLAVDYCQLFLGPRGHLPPFQSVWETGQFQSSAVGSMQRFVAAIQYDDTRHAGTMLDHLALQLDVMGHITHLEFESGPSGETLAEMGRTFFRRHLMWTKRLTEIACGRAQTDFYRSLMTLTQRFLEAEGAAP